MYFPLFLHCTFPPLCSYRDIVTVLIRRIIQSTVESSPELLHAVAASASVWGAGSLQVLELTPASRVSNALEDPLPWDLQSCWTPGPIHRLPFNATLTEPQNPSPFGLNGPIHTLPGEPTALHPGPLMKTWTPVTTSFSAHFYPWPHSELAVNFLRT